ncbi:type II toxin-antitoxin system VapC family toxin [Geomonas oryzisoli]|uniref:Type II toxin-antitoxin system VapC family toxin n=1 Tax=Geomonas oryzisoli TaxID=2847992 RepID=A0ABX8JF64_9BACT|nr:type II toxin-antitoxin system VapC family toxin [Geomonas oryzisoli]QWV95289.1 type II toxin-antitoxin system VapC family toxin [Geomonas oryzisoli]
MRRWLLDTNILSEIRKPKPQPKVINFIKQQPIETLFVSTVTFAEFRFGIELLEDAGRRAELNDWLTLRVRPMFEGRTLEITEEVMFKWRMLVDVGRKQGHTFTQPDLLIAATAIIYGMTVVTRDASDYKLTRASIFNPWADPVPS